MAKKGKEIRRSTLEEKIEKIKEALRTINIEMKPTREEFVLKVIEHSCTISGELGVELKDHPGVYVYYAEQRAALRNRLIQLEHEAKELNSKISGLIGFIVDGFRVHGEKALAEHQKKDIVAILSNIDSLEIYVKTQGIPIPSLDVSDSLKEALKEQFFHEKTIANIQSKLNVMDAVVDCLGYQKNMALRSLSELQVSGLNQERMY